MPSDQRIYIWKFDLEVKAVQDVPMPIGARPLSVSNQGLTPVLWAEVDPSADMTLRRIYTYPTGGADVQPDLVYMGSYQLPLSSGPVVGHVYGEEES